MIVQAIAFDKKFWPKISDTKVWLNEKGYFPIKKMHETRNMYHYRLADPRNFDKFVTTKKSGGIVETLGISKHESGDGLKDIVKGVAEAGKRIISSIKGPRKGPSPDVRKFLDEFGNSRITAVGVCRKPILKTIEKAGNLVSLGKLDAAMKAYNYDQLFHLYILADIVAPGSNISHSLKIEKNHVVTIYPTNERVGPPSDCITLPITGTLLDATGQAVGPFRALNHLSLKQFISNGEKYQDSRAPGTFWLYDAINNNCQVFVMSLLRGNQSHGLYSPSLEKYVMQDTAGLLTSFASRVARLVTDGAARFDILVKGNALGVEDDNKKQLEEAAELIDRASLADPPNWSEVNRSEGSRHGWAMEAPKKSENFSTGNRPGPEVYEALKLQDEDAKLDQSNNEKYYSSGNMIGEMLKPRRLGGIGHPFPTSASIFSPTLAQYYENSTKQ